MRSHPEKMRESFKAKKKVDLNLAWYQEVLLRFMYATFEG